ncbi:hypothetical protein B0H63DRAFT_289754 [Podospora didyma]|uniref:Uncharacterized protein n=1 Tax=Podospora didyma TaxID=330526 RepID=A0AAE0K8Q1_9PEZI|nr:hypothetical protein B0H63DRAFT_289754 [Podospora didyma]
MIPGVGHDMFTRDRETGFVFLAPLSLHSTTPFSLLSVHFHSVYAGSVRVGLALSFGLFSRIQGICTMFTRAALMGDDFCFYCYAQIIACTGGVWLSDFT